MLSIATVGIAWTTDGNLTASKHGKLCRLAESSGEAGWFDWINEEDDWLRHEVISNYGIAWDIEKLLVSKSNVLSTVTQKDDWLSVRRHEKLELVESMRKMTDHLETKKNTSHGNEVPPQDTKHLIERPCYQRGSQCQDPAGNRTTRRPLDHRNEMQTAVVWSCLPFIRSGQN